MDIKCLLKDNEKIGIFTICSNTIDIEVAEFHEKVTNYLKCPVNYIKINAESINHGYYIESIIKSFYNSIDYFIFLDIDCIPLKEGIVELIHDKIKDKRTVFGSAQNSNHKNDCHPFVAPSAFCISSELYKKLGEPHLGDTIPRSDTCEEITWKCQEMGYNVCLIYPTKFNPLTEEEIKLTGNTESWKLGYDSVRFGLGTTFGDLFFHGFMRNVPRSKELFIDKCRQVLGIDKEFTYKNIKGWCEFEQIFEEVVNRSNGKSNFVELGSYFGKSSALMGGLIKKSNKDIKFYSVDIFTNITNDAAYKEDFSKYDGFILPEFISNMKKCGVNEYVDPLVGLTYEMANKFPDKHFDFIFVDAAHDYESVKKDLLSWLPKLKDNGIIAGHDAATYAPGVLKALDEVFGTKWSLYAKTGTTWIVRPPKKIEAIIVCKNYSDYLKITLPQNEKYFDNIIIVTDKNDTQTQFFIKEHQKFIGNPKINCIIYDGFNKNGAKFNFGGARQFGIDNLKYRDWVCFLDSDIIIKEDFRDKLSDINKFYGSYRRFIPRFIEYDCAKTNNVLLDSIWTKIEGSGCGFFQICNLSNKKITYDDSFSAENVDILFLKKFCPLVEHDPNLVRMNIELWHLGPHGINNEGRTELDTFFNN